MMGVEINPYQLEIRNSDVYWYCGWDIASGCIWRPSWADKLELIAIRPGADT